LKLHVDTSNFSGALISNESLQCWTKLADTALIRLSFWNNGFQDIQDFMSLLSKMLIREMILPFIISFLSVLTLLVLATLLPLTEYLFSAAVTLSEFFLIVFFIIAQLWTYVLPLATVLGVMIAFNRLSRDTEMIAILACGAGPGKIIMSVAVFSAVVWLMSLLVSAFVLPEAQTSFREMMVQMTKRSLSRGIPEKVFVSPFEGMTVYVDEASRGGRHLKGIYLRDARRREAVIQVIARDGNLASDVEGKTIALKLNRGTLINVNRDYQRSDIMQFSTYLLRLSLVQEKPSLKRRNEMGLAELYDMGKNAPYPDMYKRRYLVHFHERLAKPLGALILGITAAPMGIFFGRKGISTGIAMGISTFLTYYLAMAFCSNIGEAGTIPPGIILWLPNMFFALAGLAMIYLFNRRGLVAD